MQGLLSPVIHQHLSKAPRDSFRVNGKNQAILEYIPFHPVADSLTRLQTPPFKVFTAPHSLQKEFRGASSYANHYKQQLTLVNP